MRRYFLFELIIFEKETSHMMHEFYENNTNGYMVRTYPFKKG